MLSDAADVEDAARDIARLDIGAAAAAAGFGGKDSDKPYKQVRNDLLRRARA